MEIQGPHLVLRFRERGRPGVQERHALAFRLDSTKLGYTDASGEWVWILRFQFNSQRWCSLSGPVEAVSIEHSEEGTIGVQYHDPETLALLGAEERDGSVLFERPASKRSVLLLKLRERNRFDGAGKRWKSKLAYQEPDTFQWRATGESAIDNLRLRGATGTLILRTPGRPLAQALTKVKPGRRSRPSGLATGLAKLAA